MHEYGGGAFTVIADTDEVIFSHVKDARLYRVALGSNEPTAITPESTTLRYAAMQPHPRFSTTDPYLLAVDEYHLDSTTAAGILNRLVLVDATSGEVTILREGSDFYHSPTFGGGEAGDVVSWYEWQHPNMPWESSTLYVGRLDGKMLRDVAVVAGGGKDGKPDCSVCQPKFSADGKTLFFISDATGFNLLYKWRVGGDAGPELAMEKLSAEIASGDWVFGQSRYVLLDETTALITPSIKSVATPLLLNLVDKTTTAVYPKSKADPLVVIENMRALSPSQVLLTGTSSACPSALILLSVSPAGGANYYTVKDSALIARGALPDGIFSHGQGLEFDVPGAGSDAGKQVNLNVIYHPPQNPHFEAADAAERPPAVVRIHGGPTSQALPVACCCVLLLCAFPRLTRALSRSLPRRASPGRSSTTRRAGTPSSTSTTGARPATAATIATGCGATGASSTSATRSRPSGTVPPRA